MKLDPWLPWHWLPAPNVREPIRRLSEGRRREQRFERGFDAPEVAELAAPATPRSGRLPPARPLDRVERLATSNTPIRMGDRWAIYGMSGTGKTTFARHLLAHYLEHFPEASAVVLDTNASRPFRTLPGEHYTGATPPAPPRRSGVIQVWAPPLDDADAYNRYLESAFYASTPLVVLVDELSSLAKSDSPLSYPRSLKLLYKQGRSGYKTTITLTQDAAYILRQLLGQASHIVRFRLQLPNDSDRINPYFARGADLGVRLARAPRGAVIEPRQSYGFWHVRTDQPATAREYPSWRQFL